MLNIYLGEMKEAIYHPPTYFDNMYEDEWITDPLSVKMIKDVDKSEVIGPHLIESPVLGPISPKELSGGVKTLMLMAYDENDIRIQYGGSVNSKTECSMLQSVEIIVQNGF